MPYRTENIEAIFTSPHFPLSNIESLSTEFRADSFFPPIAYIHYLPNKKAALYPLGMAKLGNAFQLLFNISYSSQSAIYDSTLFPPIE